MDSGRLCSLWPNKGEADGRPAPGEAYVRMEPVAALRPAVRTFTHESSLV